MKYFLLMILGALMMAYAVFAFIKYLRLTWLIIIAAITGFTLFLMNQEKFNETGRFKPWKVDSSKTLKLKNVKKLREAAKEGTYNVRCTAVRMLGEKYRKENQKFLYYISHSADSLELRLLASDYVDDASAKKNIVKSEKATIKGGIDYFSTEEEYVNLVFRANNPQLRADAAGKVKDENNLIKIIQHSNEYNVRLNALKNLPENSAELDRMVLSEKDRRIRLEAIQRCRNQNLLKNIFEQENNDSSIRSCVVAQISSFDVLKEFLTQEKNHYVREEIARSMLRMARNVQELSEIPIDELDKKQMEYYIQQVLYFAKNDKTVLSAMRPFAEKAIKNGHEDAMVNIPGTHRDSGYNDCHADSWSTTHKDENRLLFYKNKFPNEKISAADCDEQQLKTMIRLSPDSNMRLDAIKIIDDEQILIETVFNDPDLLCKSAAFERITDKDCLIKIAKECDSAHYRKLAMLKIDDDQIYSHVALNDSDYENRAEAITHICDESVLKKIVEKEVNTQIRLDALDGIHDPEFLKKAAIGNKQPYEVALKALQRVDKEQIKEDLLLSVHDEIRKEAVALCNDNGRLCKIVDTDKNNAVRKAALARITDEKIIAKIAAEENLPNEINLAAVEMLTSQEGFKTALKSSKSIVRKAVLEKTDDEEILKEAALKETNHNVLMTAVLKVNDENVLSDILLKSRDSSIRENIVNRIANEETLEIVALDDTNENVRYVAVQKVNNQKILAEIAQKKDSERIRISAISRLMDKKVLDSICKSKDENATIKRTAQIRRCSAEVNEK